MSSTRLYLNVFFCVSVALAITSSQSGPSNEPLTTPTQPVFRPCNDQACAPRISACQLMQSCNCELPECLCCAECMRCLGSLWTDCCDCLGLCSVQISRALPFHVVSTAGQLDATIPSLFDALSYGSNLPVVFVSRPQSTVTPTRSRNASVTSNSPLRVPSSIQRLRTCKVAFFHECRSLDQCKASCQSMGAPRFRWFHNGCCQCVGHKCIDYGGANATCRKCTQ